MIPRILSDTKCTATVGDSPATALQERWVKCFSRVALSADGRLLSQVSDLNAEDNEVEIETPAFPCEYIANESESYPEFFMFTATLSAGIAGYRERFCI